MLPSLQLAKPANALRACSVRPVRGSWTTVVPLPTGTLIHFQDGTSPFFSWESEAPGPRCCLGRIPARVLLLSWYCTIRCRTLTAVRIPYSRHEPGTPDLGRTLAAAKRILFEAGPGSQEGRDVRSGPLIRSLARARECGARQRQSGASQARTERLQSPRGWRSTPVAAHARSWFSSFLPRMRAPAW